MKILPCLLSLVLVACGPSSTAPIPSGEVRCELLGLDLTTEEAAMASFRVSNESGSSLSYQGYSKDGPLYQCEVDEAGTWQPSPLGWCGTDVGEQNLEPGKSIDFSAVVPRDGRSYRFRFGEPSVVTPPVMAASK